MVVAPRRWSWAWTSARSTWCVLNGYPGSIAATWQRSAAPGRRQRPALGVLVAEQPAAGPVRRAPSGVLRSERLARAGAHRARPAADPARPHPLRRLRAAVRRRRALRPVDPGLLLEVLAESGVLHREGGAGSGSPTATRPTRSTCARWPTATSWWSTAATAARDHRRGRLLERRADAVRGRDLHGAVARPTRSRSSTGTGRKAFVTRTRVDYYTDAIDYTKLKVLERFDGVDAPAGPARTARCTWCGACPATRRSATTPTRTSATGR
jgi:DEAD/DEAH box helicase domain-containing protein